ncbi:MAG: DUF2219 family protein [Cyclobacteriaceae bacterium]
MKKIIVIIFLSLLWLNVLGQENKRIVRGFNVQMENDMFSGMIGVRNMDKDYSGGFHIEIFTDYLNRGFLGLWRNRKEQRDIDSIGYLNLNSIYFQGMGFTPDRDQFSQSTPTAGSRPYASLIGFGFRRVALWTRNTLERGSFFRDHPFAIETDIFVGSIGSEGPGNFQNWIHEHISESDPVEGWESQIANGGRPALKYRTEVTYTAWQRIPKKIGWFRNPLNLYLKAHGTVGNIFFNAGGALAISTRNLAATSVNTALPSNKFAGENALRNQKRRINDHNQQLRLNNDKDLIEDRDSDIIPETQKFKLTFEAYVAPQYVKRNTLLQGYPSHDNSDYKIPSSEVKKMVYDIGAKVVASGPGMGGKQPDGSHTSHTILYLEIVRRSKEFNTHQSHTFVNVGLMYFFF